MKNSGSTSDFIADRDRELHASFMHVLRTATDMPLRRMFGAAARRRASRFWVSETRAAIVISAMMRGCAPERMYQKRKEMYDELCRRVTEKMRLDPDLCLQHAVNEAVYEEAPEFYLTDESARSIIYRMRQRRRRMQELRRALDLKGKTKN